MSIPGGANDLWVKRAWLKVIANENRWWWVGLNADKHFQTQFRGPESVYRIPVWNTIDTVDPIETAFPFEDATTEKAIYRGYISHIKIRGESIQIKVKCKTFKSQANLVGVGFEVQPLSYR